MRVTLALASICVAAGGFAACGPPPKPIDPKFAEVAQIHHAKCGRCHKRVEPGEKSRVRLETALKKHRKRVPALTEPQWGLLVDFLAADGQSSP
jgi:hypothetical protein